MLRPYRCGPWVSLRQPQQPVLFLALAEQQIPPREPVGACDAPGGVLHALLVDVDPTLLDRATGLALRLGEPGLDHRVDERQAVPRRGGRGGQFQRQDLEYRVVGGVRVETAEQDFGCADDLRGRVRAVDALSDVAGEGPLRLARSGVRLELGDQRVDLCAWQEGEELEVALRVPVVRVEPELEKLVDRRASGIEPDRATLRLPELRTRRRGEERRDEPVRLAPLHPADQVDSGGDVPPLIAPTHLDGALLLAA